MHTLDDVHLQFASLFHHDALFPYAAQLCRSMGEGHVCLDLNEMASPAQPLQHHLEILHGIPQWVTTNAANVRPFVLEGNRIYMQRYHAYELEIEQGIKRLLAAEQLYKASRQDLLLRHKNLLNALFPADGQTVNWQALAAVMAFQNQFSIISGGPGTGKTTTVAKLMVLLFAAQPDLKVALAAPTGKAAARMADALRGAIANIQTDFPNKSSIQSQFDTLQPQTIHRLLKPKANSTQFKHTAQNPLPYDLIVIDESSMVDVSLIAKLINAVPESSRLLLLGDRNQLASVEAGSIFGDLCQINTQPDVFESAEIHFFKQLQAVDLPALANDQVPSPLYFHLAELKVSHRFNDQQGIGKFSKAIIAGNQKAVAAFMTVADPQVQIDLTYSPELLDQFVLQYAQYINEPDIRNALVQFNHLRVLCAVREGEYGTQALNRRIEQLLQKAGLLQTDKVFYHNRPLMVTQNNPSLGLYNGDIGLVRHEADGTYCYFLDSKNELKRVLPGYLNQTETVFAMTIHKSQGSEYGNVLVVIPENARQELLTRELLYTAVTRAKQKVIVQAAEAVINGTLQRAVRRASGLGDRLQSQAINKSNTQR